MRIIRSTISIGVTTYGTVPSSHANAGVCAQQMPLRNVDSRKPSTRELKERARL
jgi:hypothetical protein